MAQGARSALIVLSCGPKLGAAETGSGRLDKGCTGSSVSSG